CRYRLVMTQRGDRDMTSSMTTSSMTESTRARGVRLIGCAGVAVMSMLVVLPGQSAAQDRLPTMPGYDQYQRMAAQRQGAVQPGAATEIEPAGGEEGRFGRRGGPERGRQFDSAESPDGTLKAFYRDRNLWLSRADGTEEKAITTEGSEADRVKYGTASWVYGEE